MDIVTYALCKGYVKKSIAELENGTGSLKGKNCVVKSIDTTTDPTKAVITFGWTGNDNIEYTDSIDIEYKNLKNIKSLISTRTEVTSESVNPAHDVSYTTVTITHNDDTVETFDVLDGYDGAGIKELKTENDTHGNTTLTFIYDDDKESEPHRNVVKLPRANTWHEGTLITANGGWTITDSKIGDFYFNRTTAAVYKRTDYDQVTGTTINNYWEKISTLQGPEGDSAYEVWLTIDGNQGKSKTDFILAISGEGMNVERVWEKPALHDETTNINQWYVYQVHDPAQIENIPLSPNKAWIGTKQIDVLADGNYVVKVVNNSDETIDQDYYYMKFTVDDGGLTRPSSMVAAQRQAAEFAHSDTCVHFRDTLKVTKKYLAEVSLTIPEGYVELDLETIPQRTWIMSDTAWLTITNAMTNVTAGSSYYVFNGVNYWLFDLPDMPSGLLQMYPKGMVALFDERLMLMWVCGKKNDGSLTLLGDVIGHDVLTSATIPEGYITSPYTLTNLGKWVETCYAGLTKEDASEVTLDFGSTLTGLITEQSLYTRWLGNTGLYNNGLIYPTINDLHYKVEEGYTEDRDGDGIVETKGYDKGVVFGIEPTEVDVGISDAQDLKTATRQLYSMVKNLKFNYHSPVGAIMALSADWIPAGWLECNGQAVSRTSYSKLFEVIGVKYGAGDGITTFNLPDYRKRFLEGTDVASNNVGTNVAAGLPNITGQVDAKNRNDGRNASIFDGFSGAFVSGGSTNTAGGIPTSGCWGWATTMKFDANSGATVKGIYGNSNTVQPNSSRTIYVIFTGHESADTDVDIFKLYDSHQKSIRFGHFTDGDGLDHYGYYKQGEGTLNAFVTEDFLDYYLRFKYTAPVGMVAAFPDHAIPAGWLQCNGQEVSKKVYKKLWAKLHDTYGTPSSNSLFKLPNLTHRFVEGSNTVYDSNGNIVSSDYGQVLSAGLPNITGKLSAKNRNDSRNASIFDGIEGAFSSDGNNNSAGGISTAGSWGWATSLKFNANSGATVQGIYGNSNTVQPNSIRMVYCIFTGEVVESEAANTFALFDSPDDSDQMTIRFGHEVIDGQTHYGYYKHEDGQASNLQPFVTEQYVENKFAELATQSVHDQVVAVLETMFSYDENTKILTINLDANNL